MSKVRQAKEWTESDALAEIIAVDPRDFVLETSPPDYVEKISQLLGSSVEQTGRDGAAADPADTDSDSADSLFITQKPVPEAVRSGRRQRHSVRPGPASLSFQEDSEDDSSPLASPQESTSKNNKKRVKFRLPKYSFPFLKDRALKRTSTVLPGPQNIRLHYSAVGGFFDCVRKLQQSCQTREDLESNLLTVDMNGECIFPISEGEEETLEDADMKVVAKKRFVVQSKVKHSQPWYREKTDGEVKQQRTSCVNAVRKMSRGWRKTLHKVPTKRPSLTTALSSNLESSDDEDSSYRILGEGGTSDEQQAGERSVPAQAETPKTNRSLNREKKDKCELKEKERELCDDSSAPLCEQSPKESILEGREASVTEPNGAHSITTCSETRVKKKKNDKEVNESAEEDASKSQEEPELQHATPSVNEEITEVEETPHLPQTVNEPELHDKRMMEESDISDSQQKKKKKHNTSPAEDVRQEVHEHFESDVRIGEDSVHLDGGGKKKKKKKKKDEEMGQSQEEVDVRHAAAYMNVCETPRLSQVASELDLNAKAGMEESDISDSRQKKKKKKKRKNESSAEDVRQEAHEHSECDVRIGEDSAHLVSFNRGKKKKKKKKNDNEDNGSVEEEKSQRQKEPELQHATPSVNEEITKVEETPHLPQTINEPELHDKHMMEESDISDSQQKKKKMKKKRKNESSAEDVRQEVHEDAPHLVSSNRGKKKKKKKKNDKEDNESVEEEKSQSQEELDVQHAAAYVNEGITEEEETPHLPESFEPAFSEKHVMEESEVPDLQQKKKKKKRKNESPAENEKTEKVKKKTESSVDEEDSDQLKHVTAPESLHDGVEMLTEKIAAAQCDVSVSESVAAGKPGVSAGGPGESAGITGGLEESNERVRKKKKKRKMTAAQESVEKDQELDFEELKGACEEALSDTRVRKKKKRKRNETESESAVDAGCSDDAAVVKKKWEKSVEGAPAARSEEKDGSHCEPPSSYSVMKDKQKNLKRHLYNPSGDFLTDF